MLCLPTELRRLCLEPLDAPPQRQDDTSCSDSLKALRLVSKDLSTLATGLLFRRVILNHNEDSEYSLDQVIRSDHNPLVRKVTINTGDDPSDAEGYSGSSFVESYFKDALSVLGELKNLEEVEIRFSRECGLDVPLGEESWSREDISFRVEVLGDMFESLQRTDKFRSLSIENLQDYHDPNFFEQHKSYLGVRNRLTRLHLQITNQQDRDEPEKTMEYASFHDGFTRSLPNIWLKPLTHQLTHLTLYGANQWGVWPIVDFRRIHPFPHLRSLCLGNWTIAHAWQIEWIIAHGSSLEELVLDNCPIIVALRMSKELAQVNFPEVIHRAPDDYNHYARVDLRWHEIFTRLQSTLSRLRRFAFGAGRWKKCKAFQERYYLTNAILPGRYGAFENGIGIEPSTWIEYGEHMLTFPEGLEKPSQSLAQEEAEGDMKALMALMQVVRSRESSR